MDSFETARLKLIPGNLTLARVAAGLGTVFFGLFATVGDYRLALIYASFLFLPAARLVLL